MRFLIEARAAARLQHPNVVSIHRVGEVSGRPFIVSEFVHGASLDKIPKPMPWQQALELGIGLARGLAAAHTRGVLHRDIKPANAMLADSSEVKLLDFSLAKLDLEASASSMPSGSGHALVALAPLINAHDTGFPIAARSFDPLAATIPAASDPDAPTPARPRAAALAPTNNATAVTSRLQAL